MSNFVEVKTEEWKVNPFQTIGKQWMAVTAEKDGKVNAMTASWGGLGVMWGQDVAMIVVRPQRFTKEMIDAGETFSLSFLGQEHRKELNYLGMVSGRYENKVEKCGFTVLHEGKTPYFGEAETVLICRKLFAQEMKEESFIDTAAMEKWYPNKDYHTLYVAAIEKILIKGE